ncbi:SNF2 domain-containing protein CLASSY 3 [Abeliophyllum distichum]|uniref:SNF2 domain-containing protein CLASSY 3 n=1 Tax=Abeliophyllum distichum TaxID=126358 RepID=A0ABD1PAK2_9LAMI
MPPWVEKTYREPDRKISSDTKHLYMCDGLDLSSSVDKFTVELGDASFLMLQGLENPVWLLFSWTYLSLFPKCRSMIIAPASMLLTWEEEFRKWEVKFPFHYLGSLEFSRKENKLSLKHLPKRQCLHKDTVRWVKAYSWDKGPSVLGISYTLYEKLAGEELVKGKGRNRRERENHR